MQSFELFQEQVPAFAGKTCESVHLCIALDKARTGYMLDFALTFLRCMNKHNLLHVLPGIDRASAITLQSVLRAKATACNYAIILIVQEQVPAFAGMTCESVHLCVALDKSEKGYMLDFALTFLR
jgi:hypothetical protein